MSRSGLVFFFQAEDGIRYLVRSRGLGDVYKRQGLAYTHATAPDGRRTRAHAARLAGRRYRARDGGGRPLHRPVTCLLYTSDAADERSSVDLGGRRIIKKKNTTQKKKKTKENNYHKTARYIYCRKLKCICITHTDTTTRARKSHIQVTTKKK